MAKKTTKSTTKKAAASPETKVAAEAKTEEVTKEEVKKTAAAPKKKTAPKKAETASSISHFFEIDGEQISTSDIEEKINIRIGLATLSKSCVSAKGGFSRMFSELSAKSH